MFVVILKYIMWIGVDNVNINETVGVIRDAIFYCSAYFKRKTVLSDPPINIDENVQLFHYDSLRTIPQVPDPPDCLFPLFYYNGFIPHSQLILQHH